MITGTALAEKGVEMAIGKRIDYAELDCQGYMEEIFSQCGQKISYRGSNDMFRNACSWIGTIDEAKQAGHLKPGAALFILEHNGGEPDQYKADGIGNASHVGMYTWEGALRDLDKNGSLRTCNVVHSSSSMGRVAGSTLKNGWTHVGLWKNVDFGLDSIQRNESESMSIENVAVVTMGKIMTENLKPVNFRKKANREADLIPRMPEINHGELVQVNSYLGDWANVTYQGYTGYIMKKFIGSAIEAEEPAKSETTSAEDFVDTTIGSVEEKAKLYRVYIDFTNRKEAMAFYEAMRGCQVGSVK